MNDKRLIFEAYLGRKQKNIYFCWYPDIDGTPQGQFALSIASNENEAIGMYIKGKNLSMYAPNLIEAQAWKIGVATPGLPAGCISAGYKGSESSYLKLHKKMYKESLDNNIYVLILVDSYMADADKFVEFAVASSKQVIAPKGLENNVIERYCIGVAYPNIPPGVFNMKRVPKNWSEIKKFKSDEDRDHAIDIMRTLD